MYELSDEDKRLLQCLSDPENRGASIVDTERQAINSALMEIHRWRKEAYERSNESKDAWDFEVKAIDLIREREAYYRGQAANNGIGTAAGRAWGLREAIDILTRDRVVSKARR